MSTALGREDVLAFRVRAQQLDRAHGELGTTAVLDLGVQDTGADGALWALANRGVHAPDPRQLVTVWTVRGAPHVYRQEDLPSVAAAVAPFSDDDAGKRIFDASKPLKAAGIGNLEALDAVAAAMRDVVTAPMVKGEVSRELAARMPAPYLRHCRPCNATHLYEQPFRLAAIRAGLVLEPGTSPPVLTPVPGFGTAETVPARFDVVRACLRLLGPTTPQLVAAYLDAPLRDVKSRWPADAAEVEVEGEHRWLLESDVERLGVGAVAVVRLLGPFDVFLQSRDRKLLVPDPARVKELWPTLGRPGAMLVDGEIAGTWRPRKKGRRLEIELREWRPTDHDPVEAQAERLAEHRGLILHRVDWS